MSRLVKIASWQGELRGSVVFVHGLGGHVYDTWRRGADDTFWPVWLAEEVEGVAVYSLAYEAPVSNWLGTSMPLQDRAVNIFEVLLTEPGLRTGPIVFACRDGLAIRDKLTKSDPSNAEWQHDLAALSGKLAPLEKPND